MDFLFNHLFGILDAVLILITAVTGYIVIKNVKRETIIKIQEQTIDAYTDQNKVLQDQIDTLKNNIIDLKRGNEHQQFIIQSIQEALLKRGILITIDGEMVTISDSKGTSNTIRRLRKPQTQEEK